MDDPRHPLFARPWRELRWILWVAYGLGTPVVTALTAPVPKFTDLQFMSLELLRNGIGVVFGSGIIHLLYAVVVPRVWTPPRSLARLALSHLAVLVIALLVGSELTMLVSPQRAGGPTMTELRLQYYQFGIVYGSALIVGLVGYDRLRDQAIASRIGEELAQQKARVAQLEALQIRTDPHFLFNVLNSIAALIKLEPARAIASVEQVSELFRFMLGFSHSRTITLSTELEVVRRYLEIEALRYDNLEYALDVDDAVVDARLLPMTIQPLVENAVKHGVALHDGSGRITLGIRGNADRLQIGVENAADDPSADHALFATRGSGKSLAILRERLRLAYGDRAEFHHGREAGRYAVRVEIPLER